MSEANKFDFKTISKIICDGTFDHDKIIRQQCVKSSIFTLDSFYDSFQCEMKKILSEITASKEYPSICDFADIFKSFDVYPANITKVKKSGGKELQRMNSTISKGGTAVQESIQKENSSTSLNNSKIQIDCRMSASEILKDYLNSKKKLNMLLQELQNRSLTEEHNSKLKQIDSLAQQLEKLLPSDGNRMPAFSREEELKLQQLVHNMEKLGFLQENQDMFNSLGGNSISRLESLVDVLSYSLISISCFNVI